MAAVRRVVISLLMLLVIAAIVSAVVGRARRSTDTKSSFGVRPAPEAVAPTPASTASTDKPTPVQTSEDLIATAFKAGRITYEQSLLARAYALYDDPRLSTEFRSPVIDWEAGTALFIEIDKKEAMLSNQALTDLAPFRARPNDPISIFNRPRAEVLKAQNRPATGWESRKVQGTNVRIWIKGTQAQLDRFGPMVASVWSVYAAFFPYPINDAGGTSSAINPDSAIDLYFMNGGDSDPRADICAGNGNDIRCILGSHGITWPTEPTGALSSSAYCLINMQHSDDEVLGTIAHELAHAAQMKYDYREHDMPGSKWLTEGSATWVEHRVLKRLRKIPTMVYSHLENQQAVGMFDNLHRSLDDRYHWYGTWLFFNYASMELGDGIVKTIWEKASSLSGTAAVDRVVPFKDHFPRFAVRNWNKDPVPDQYKTRDDTFPPDLKPLFADLIEDPPLKKELLAPVEPLPHLASAYFPFKFPSHIRRVTVENMYWDMDDAHLWAIRRIRQDWQQPEDWSKDQQHTFCRDLMEEDLSELVLIVSNSNPASALPPHPRPRVLSEPVGCPFIKGWAHATLRLKDSTNDATYDSGRVELRFKPRPTAPGEPADVVEYDLLPGGMTWNAYGRIGNCTICGAAGVTFDGPGNDTSRLAWGYMKVTGVGAANDHAFIVQAGTMSPITKTCPGPPRQVIKEPPAASKLLLITSAPNTNEGDSVVFKGKQTYDIGDPLASVSPGYLEALKMMPKMREALGTALKGRAIYTFEWELRPQNGAGTPPPDTRRR